MDIWTWIQTLGIAGVIAGLALLLVWRGKILPELGSTGQMVALIVGGVLLAGSALGLGWLNFGATQQADDGVDAGIAIWDVTDSESQAWLVPIAGSNSYEVRVTYNTTSNAFEGATGTFEVNYTIERSDVSDTADFTTCEITDVGSFTAITGTDAGETKELIALDASGDYDVDWNKNSGDGTGFVADTSDLNTQFPRENTHRDGWVSVNVTLNSACVDLMSAVGDSASITVDIAGTPYTFIVRLNTLNT